MHTARVAAEGLRASCIEDDAVLGRLAEDWNRLAGDVPFRRWDWLEASWRHFRTPRRRLFIVAVHNAEGELIGLAPWYLQKTVWQGSVVRFLGSDEACSDYLSVLAAPGRADDVALCIADWLAGDGRGRWDLLELSGVDATDPVLRRLTESLERQRHTLHAQGGLCCWRLRLPDDWDSYLATLSRNRRQKCRSSYRKAFGSGKAVLRSADDANSLQQGMEILVDLHERRRASIGGRGCFSSERFHRFIVDVARRFFSQEALRLQWIEVGGVPVAADFSLRGGQCTYGYQCGMNPDYADLRPGRLMMIANLKSAIEEGYREFDFLRGEEGYKSHWGAERRPSLQLRVVPPQVAARTKHSLWLTGTKVKQLLKQSRRLVRIPWTPKC